MITAEQRASYKSEGYTVVSGVFPGDAVEAMQNAVDELSRRAAGFTEDTFLGPTFFNLYRGTDPFTADPHTDAPQPGCLLRVTYPYAQDATLDRMRIHPPLLDCVRRLVAEEDLVQIVNQVNFNPPKTGSGWGWHQDYRFRRPGLTDAQHSYVQTLTALDPCTETTGGLRLVPRSHELGALALDQQPQRAPEYFDEDQAITPHLQPGDVLFFNPYVIHGSSPNRSQQKRRVYINGFARRSQCSYGRPVLKNGQPLHDSQTVMEYEGDEAMISAASKY